MHAFLSLFDLPLVSSTIRLVSPILLAALGGMFTARAGIFNIALEGMMLTAAFFAVAGLYWTNSAAVGLLLAVLSSLVVALVFAFFVIEVQGDPIVIGLAVNILALGLTTYMMQVVFGVQGSFYNPNLHGLPNLTPPGGVPAVDTIFSGFSILVYVAFAAVIGAQILLFRTPLGLRLRAVGEDPIAAGSVGISVRGMRYLSACFCGIMCGLAGAELSISLVTQFVQGMTAGRGFVALVAVMFGQALPYGVLGASILFGFAYALALRLQSIGIPPQFVFLLPYLVTILALILLAARPRRRARQGVTGMKEVAAEEAEVVETTVS